MRTIKLSKIFSLMEPGPVVLVTTRDGRRNNVMTISWTMVLDFKPRFVMTTGEWNYSYNALRKTRECVIAIPTVDMLETVVGVGTCSGADTDKFEKFGLTPLPGRGDHSQARYRGTGRGCGTPRLVAQEMAHAAHRG